MRKLRRLGKTLLAVAAVLAATVLGSVIPAGAQVASAGTRPAMAASPALAEATPIRLKDLQFYDPFNADYCWTEHSDVPYYVFLNASCGNDDAQWAVYLDEGICDAAGTVTATCPFAEPAMDRAVEGHEIYSFQSLSPSVNGLCIQVSSTGYLDSGTCTFGSNELFIPEGNYSVYQSVGASNLVYTEGGRYPADVEDVCPDNVPNEALLWNYQGNCPGTGESYTWGIRS